MSDKYNKRIVFKKTGGGYERKTYGGMSVKNFKIPVLAPFPTIDTMSGLTGPSGTGPSGFLKFGRGIEAIKPTDIFDEINKRLGVMKIKTKRGGAILEF